MERAYFSELGNAREEINAWNSEKSLTINVSAQSSSPLWWANFGDAGESGVLLKHLNDETEAGRPKFDRPMDDVERLVEEQKRAEEGKTSLAQCFVNKKTFTVFFSESYLFFCIY